ncbi:hypothetical protein [Pseudomonas sp. URMO17WK12:I11]|uniref:hypothetical protein n=1 Tax=Pseudomonas sp. URMO17WK12:I11 TaxID=1283291 RepID=UPI0012E33B2C|nr:hypothetical protein [Pseudomonas sp. URMO17WK12:I11]
MKAPSYIADLLLIKIPERIAENLVIKDSNGTLIFDFSNSRCVSYFFHEWLHYVHNVSTVNGVYAFASIINMWANFRHKIDSSGISTSENKLSTRTESIVKRTHIYRMNSRRLRDNPAEIQQINIKSELISAHPITSKLSETVPDHPTEEFTVIQCEVRVNDNQNLTLAEIGIVEIIEGVASLLEERFLLMHGELPTPSNIAPYRLILVLARKLVPDIKNDEIVACAISSLQCEDPPLALMEILITIEKIPSDQRLDRLKNITIARLNEYAKVLDDIFTQTENIFPLLEPMGNSVKDIIKIMKEKIDLRKKAPFFELLMLDQVKSEPIENRDTRLKNIIAEFSCPRILLTQAGEETLNRDEILNFGNPAWITDEFQFGQQKLHSALHFLWLHLSEDGFLDTDDTPESKVRRCCPFFTACPHQIRKEHPQICESKPWETLQIPMDPELTCWYRAGVRATRPPQD